MIPVYASRRTALSAIALFPFVSAALGAQSLANDRSFRLVAAGDGSDETERLQEAIRLAVGGSLILTGDFRISRSIVLPGDVYVKSESGARIIMHDKDLSLFVVTKTQNVRISGLRFLQIKYGKSAYVGGIFLNESSHCYIENCEFEGMQWAGIYLANSNDNVIYRCAFKKFGGNVPDCADIQVYYNSSGNVIQNNNCYGGKYTGINVQDPGGAGKYTPARNRIVGNRVGPHSQYGINIYIGGLAPINTYNTVEDNIVEGITSASFSSAGSGIYGVGNGIGGLIVRGNHVRNCCSAALDRRNAPGGIGVSGIPVGVARPVIERNQVEAMVQGDGILIATAPGGAIVRSNVVRMPRENAGTGPGGRMLLGSGVRFDNASNVDCIANKVVHEGAGAGILLLASTARQRGVRLEANRITTAANVAIRLAGDEGLRHAECLISDNECSVLSISNGMQLEGLDRSVVRRNSVSSKAAPALNVATCTDTTFSGNVLKSAGAYVAVFAGNCAGSRFDGTSRSGAAILNLASGLITGGS